MVNITRYHLLQKRCSEVKLPANKKAVVLQALLDAYDNMKSHANKNKRKRPDDNLDISSTNVQLSRTRSSVTSLPAQLQPHAQDVFDRDAMGPSQAGEICALLQILNLSQDVQMLSSTAKRLACLCGDRESFARLLNSPSTTSSSPAYTNINNGSNSTPSSLIKTSSKPQSASSSLSPQVVNLSNPHDKIQSRSPTVANKNNDNTESDEASPKDKKKLTGQISSFSPVLQTHPNNIKIYNSYDDLEPGVHYYNKINIKNIGQKRICSIDPGRNSAVTAVTHHLKPLSPPSEQSTSARKRARLAREQAARQTTYKLSSKRWRKLSGITDSENKLIRWRQRNNYDEMYQRQLVTTYKTSKVGTYHSYLQTLWISYDEMWEAAFAKIVRTQRFERFKQKQRALEQVSREICGNDFENCVLLWGNGSFSPSFGKGNPPAPNKALYRYIGEVKKAAIVISDESYSSQIPPCHPSGTVWHPHVHDPFGNDLGELWRTSRCSECHRMWNRDIAACVIIFMTFLKFNQLDWPPHAT